MRVGRARLPKGDAHDVVATGGETKVSSSGRRKRELGAFRGSTHGWSRRTPARWGTGRGGENVCEYMKRNIFQNSSNITESSGTLNDDDDDDLTSEVDFILMLCCDFRSHLASSNL